MKLCKDCPYFCIDYEPQKMVGLGYTECGQASCKKYGFVTNFLSHKKFETLGCIVRNKNDRTAIQ